MKIEVEINQDVIEVWVKDAVFNAVKKRITEYSNSFAAQSYTSDAVISYFKTTVDALVAEEMKNLPKVRDQVELLMAQRIKSQLTKLMKTDV